MILVKRCKKNPHNRFVQIKRVLLLFSLLTVLVVVVTVLAYDDYSRYSLYEFMDSVTPYETYIESCNEYEAKHNGDDDAYTSFYNEPEDGYTSCSEYSQYNDFNPEHGQINEEPYYNYDDEDLYIPDITPGLIVNISADDVGNITIYPYMPYSVVLDDRGYIHISIPVGLEKENVGISLPFYGWTYEITHETQPESATYTIVSIAHTWNSGGYVNFMPLVINSPYGTPFPINPGATPLDWITAIGSALDGNRVISVQGDVAMPSSTTFSISGSRSVIIASNDTDLSDHTHPSTPFTISRLPGAGGNGRHFTVSGGATLTLSNIVLDGNRFATTLVTRGGIVVDNANLVMQSGSAIFNCFAETNGGAIEVYNGSFVMYGGTIGHTNLNYGNRAIRGGGVWISGNGASFRMDSGSIIGNIAQQVGNVLTGGGGVWVDNGADFTMNYGHIRDNEVRIEHPVGHGTGGGGVFVTGTGGNIDTSFTMHDGLITNNHVIAVTAVDGDGGGGVKVHDNGHFIMNGGAISINHAPHGGGVRVRGLNVPDSENPNPSFVMTGGFIEDNVVPGNGGGVHIAQTIFTMDVGADGAGGTIRRNTALIGGGVRVVGTTTLNMHSGTISSNIAAGSGASGGGLHVQGANARFNMYGGVVGGDTSMYANTAPTGAGMHISGGARVVMCEGMLYGEPTRGTIAHNIATGTGGGVLLAGVAPGSNIPSMFDLNAGYVRNNAAGGGAGVRAQGQSRFTMRGGEIHTNHSTAQGGGVALADNGTAFILRGGQIHNNEATPAGASGGGGVRVFANSSFSMHDGRIFNNSASAGSGGGVNSAGNFTMYGGQIYGNRAAVNGGGVFHDSPAAFNMHGGVIGGPADSEGIPIPANANTAVNGAGVWVASGRTFIMADFVDSYGVVHPAMRHIEGNRATGTAANQGGGGVWVAGNANFTADGAQIIYNTAAGMGGGIFSAAPAYEYASPLTRISGPDTAFGNLNLTNIEFFGNRAYALYHPPVNAIAATPHLGFENTSQPIDPAPYIVHPLNNFDINFRVPSVLFEFYKTCGRLHESPRVFNLLHGAQFRVFRTGDDSVGTGMDGLVVVDALNNPNAPWENVTMERSISQSGSGAEPVAFYMLPGFIYQLVEYMAPSGFQIPMGQWRMWVDETAPGGIAFASIGDVVIPAFIYIESAPTPGDVRWFVHNLRQIELPLTGGNGSATPVMAVAGTSLVGVAFLVVLILNIRKRRQH
ncbi:MAG: hypothetical protein FWE11_07125 [Defluviitaleaceae bacterium]|nr:hypothetical protein [Defluviitaleaceae bacterium]